MLLYTPFTSKHQILPLADPASIFEDDHYVQSV